MGVLACNRRGCPNIMCDRYSHTYGYICSDCFIELCDKPNISIREFMNTEKDDGFVPDIKGEWEKHLNVQFPMPEGQLT